MTTTLIRDALRDLKLTVQETRRVLVVDDEPEILALLESVLGPTCQVLSAQSAEVALELLKEQGVDLIITDQRMPGMTGVELLEIVAERWPRTVRVILTGYEDAEPMLSAVNTGQVYRYLLKPFNAAEMRSLVDEALVQHANSKALDMTVARLAEQGAALTRTHGQIVAAEEDLTADRMATLVALLERLAVDALGHLAMCEALLEEGQRASESIDADIREAIERVHLAAQGQVERLVSMADVAAGSDAALRRSEISASQLVEGALALFRLAPGCAPRQVTVTLDERLGRLRVAPAATRQALLALLHNAALSSRQGQPIEVVLGGHQATGVSLEVRDQGGGMEQEVLARASEPFFSAFGTNKDKDKDKDADEDEDAAGLSLGFGLAVARRVAEAHGGSLEFESVEARGTVARLILVDANMGGVRGEASS